MKKLLLVAAVMASALGAMAQGTVNFKNSAPVNQPVFNVDNTTRLTSTFSAQLLWSATAGGTFVAATLGDGSAAAAAVFRDGTGAGFWNAGSDTGRKVGVAAGAAVFLKVQAWDNTGGATFATSNTKGESAVFSVTTGGAGDPPSLPADLTTFTSFKVSAGTVIPEPSTIALGLLGAGALLLRRRK